jgi:hypothetical protein
MTPNSEYRQIGARCCIAGGLFVLLGIGAFCGGQWVQPYLKRVARWPSVSGKIAVSEVSTATVRAGRVVRSSLIADIRYDYSVEGTDYRGEQLRPLPMLHMKSEGTPEEIVSRYPVGLSVSVYYDPADPRAAVLVPEVGADCRNLLRALTICGSCLALLGLMLTGIGTLCWFGNPDSAPAAAPRAVIAPQAPPAVKLGLVPRILRGAAIAVGLFVFLIGSLLLAAAARMPNPSGDESTRVVAMVIVGGGALLGAGLIYAGVRRPRVKSLAGAA